MFLEKLRSKKGNLRIGIEHIQKSQKLNRNEILELLEDEPQILAAQFLDSSLIVDNHHLLSAAQNALYAWEGAYAVSRSLNVEILLFASGQRQISVALDNLGIDDNPETLLVVVVGEEETVVKQYISELVSSLGEAKTPMFEPNSEKLEKVSTYYDISNEEITAISDSTSLKDRWRALSRAVVSRVSMVALDL